MRQRDVKEGDWVKLDKMYGQVQAFTKGEHGGTLVPVKFLRFDVVWPVSPVGLVDVALLQKVRGEPKFKSAESVRYAGISRMAFLKAQHRGHFGGGERKPFWATPGEIDDYQPDGDRTWAYSTTSWYVVLQPNGKYAIFTGATRTFTAWGMTHDEAVRLCVEQYGMVEREAIKKVKIGTEADLRYEETMALVKRRHGNEAQQNAMRLMSE